MSSLNFPDTWGVKKGWALNDPKELVDFKCDLSLLKIVTTEMGEEGARLLERECSIGKGRIVTPNDWNVIAEIGSSGIPVYLGVWRDSSFGWYRHPPNDDDLLLLRKVYVNVLVEV